MLFQKTDKPSSESRPKIKKSRGNQKSEKQKECRDEKESGNLPGNEEKSADGEQVFRVRRSKSPDSDKKRDDEKRDVRKEEFRSRKSCVRDPYGRMRGRETEQNRRIGVPDDAGPGSPEHTDLNGECRKAEKRARR